MLSRNDEPPRVLIAEDDPQNQKVSLIILRCLGYRADGVNYGPEVLEALKLQAYDLMLMEIKMPETD
jgi:CheY-like chemotaxis protein